MGENVLKKEFGKKDVTRLRNLMMGKHNDKNGQSVGYNKKEVFHKEGDIWEVDGRKWTIKDGLKQNVTKLDRAKKAYLKPLMCPKCDKIMNKGADPGYYNQFGHCFHCFKVFESHLKHDGLWDEFEKRVVNGNVDAFIKWYRDMVNEALNDTNAGFVSEAGDVEKWNGGLDKTKVMEALGETIELWEQAKK
tara:strand:- start:225 stop:797 length:573 start_codon:yes stop_codon:yes gene_type:complete